MGATLKARFAAAVAHMKRERFRLDPWMFGLAAILTVLIITVTANARLPSDEVPRFAPRVGAWLLGAQPDLPQRFVRRVTAEHRAEVARIVVAAAQRHGVDPVIALAVATQESGLRPADAVTGPRTGRVGGYQRARGTMQILPSTGRAMGCGNLQNTDANVDCGVRYLRDSLRRYGGNVDLAVRSYHGGHNRRFWGPNNANYARSVHGHIRRLGGRHGTFFASSRQGSSPGAVVPDERYPHTWGR